MPAALQPAASAAGDQARQVGVLVQVAVADAAAVDGHRVVEEVAVAVRGLPQLLEETAQQRDVIEVDLRLPGHVVGVVPVVGHGVVLVRNPDLREGPGTGLASQHQRPDAGDVGLPGEGQQIEHQRGVLLEVLGDVDGAVGQVDLGPIVPRLGASDALLEVAHRVEILAQLVAVGRPQGALEAQRLLGHRVENAAGLPHLGAAVGRGAAIAEQPLEHHAGVGLHLQRSRGVAPGDGVRVEAVARVARDGGRLLEHQLERRQRRLGAEIAGRELVGGGAELDRRGADAPAALPGVHPAQPDGGRPRVVAVAVTERVGLPVGEAAHHEQPVLHRREGAEGGRQREPGAGRGRHELLLDHPVGDVHEAQPGSGTRGGPRQGGRRRHHGVEQRQRHGGAQAAEERSTG